MNDDIRKLNDDELDTISGGKTNVPDFLTIRTIFPRSARLILRVSILLSWSPTVFLRKPVFSAAAKSE